jgi:hypothetical protein
MNCISWIIAHLANQQHVFFLDLPKGKESALQYRPCGYGSAAS